MFNNLQIPSRLPELTVFTETVVSEARAIGQRVMDLGDHYETIQPDGAVVRLLKE